MSDTPQGDGWWLASDGKWYPPVTASGQPPDPAQQSVPAKPPWWRQPWTLIAGAAIVVVVLVVAVVLVGGDDEGDGEVEAGDTSAAPATTVTTAVPTTTVPPTTTAVPTTTTATPTTSTAAPTTTTAAPTTTSPALEPIVYEGTGGSVVTLDALEDARYVARLTHDGPSNFSVWLLDDSGGNLELLVNTIGPYEGVRPFAWENGPAPASLRIDAGSGSGEGSWSIVLDDPGTVPSVATMPGTTHTDTGDRVLQFQPSGPTVIDVACEGCDAGIVINGYGTEGRELIVDEVGPYSGTHTVKGGTAFLEVVASMARVQDAEWTITVQ